MTERDHLIIHGTLGIYNDLPVQQASVPASAAAEPVAPVASVASVAPVVPDVLSGAAPVAAVNQTVKLYQDAPSAEIMAPAVELPPVPAVQPEPAPMQDAPAAEPVVMYVPVQQPAAELPPVAPPPAPVVPAPVQPAEAPAPGANSTVKLYASISPENMPAGPFADAAHASMAAAALRPSVLPDRLQRFSPEDVDQTISELTITWNGQAYSFPNPVEISIGREAGNALIVRDAHVSGSHAVLNCSHSRVMVRNVSRPRDGKQNPLYINDRVILQPAELHNGDILKLNCVPMQVTWQTSTLKRPVTPPPIQLQQAHATLPVAMNDGANHTMKTLRLSVTWKLPGQEDQTRLVVLSPLLPVVIGRSEKDDLFINDPYYSISRSHLTLEMRAGEALLRNTSVDRSGNMGYNPVYLDGQKLEADTPLAQCMNKELAMGHVRLTIRPAE